MGQRVESDLLIMPARDEDIPAIAAIYGHHVRHGLASFETEPPSLRELGARRGELRAQGFPFLAGFHRDRLIGYAYAGPYHHRRAYRFTVEDSVYVDPAFTGRGVGRRLLVALIHECELRGYRQMIALIGDSGNVASIRLHAGAGFAPVGTLRSVGFKHGRWVDVVIMQRALGAGDGDPQSDGDNARR